MGAKALLRVRKALRKRTRLRKMGDPVTRSAEGWCVEIRLRITSTTALRSGTAYPYVCGGDYYAVDSATLALGLSKLCSFFEH